MIPFGQTVVAYSFAVFFDSTVVGETTSGVSAPPAPRVERDLERSYNGIPPNVWPLSQGTGSAVSDEVPVLVGPQRPEDTAAAEIRSFSNLRQGWDGEDAAKPSSASILQAIDFIRVAGPLASALEATLHVDGSVLLELGDGADGSLKFNGDDTVVYAIEEYGRGSVAFDGLALPPELRLALSSRA